jgi:hypothetical protein
MVKPDSSVACIKLCRADHKTAEVFEFLCLRDSASQSVAGRTRDFDVIITAAERSDRLLPNTSSLRMQYAAGACWCLKPARSPCLSTRKTCRSWVTGWTCGCHGPIIRRSIRWPSVRGRRALADLGRMVVRPPAKAIALWPSHTSLKIASASTACARKPTVKASVRKIGRPSV